MLKKLPIILNTQSNEISIPWESGKIPFYAFFIFVITFITLFLLVHEVREFLPGHYLLRGIPTFYLIKTSGYVTLFFFLVYLAANYLISKNRTLSPLTVDSEMIKGRSIIMEIKKIKWSDVSNASVQQKNRNYTDIKFNDFVLVVTLNNGTEEHLVIPTTLDEDQIKIFQQIITNILQNRHHSRSK